MAQIPTISEIKGSESAIFGFPWFQLVMSFFYKRVRSWERNSKRQHHNFVPFAYVDIHIKTLLFCGMNILWSLRSTVTVNSKRGWEGYAQYKFKLLDIHVFNADHRDYCIKCNYIYPSETTVQKINNITKWEDCGEKILQDERDGGGNQDALLKGSGHPT